jgi:hypothetical protein
VGGLIILFGVACENLSQAKRKETDDCGRQPIA